MTVLFVIVLISSVTVDLTSEAGVESRSRDEASLNSDEPANGTSSNLADEERGFFHSGDGRSMHSPFSNGNDTESTRAEETELQSRRGSITSNSSAFVKRKTSQFLNVINGNQLKSDAPLAPQVSLLVEAYAASEIATSIRVEIESASNRNTNEELPNVAEEDRLLRGRRGASWLTQFRILSGRAFKNLYRDPALLMAHYLSSIILARALFSFRIVCLTTEEESMDSHLWFLLPIRQVSFDLYLASGD